MAPLPLPLLPPPNDLRREVSKGPLLLEEETSEAGRRREILQPVDPTIHEALCGVCPL